MRVGDLSCSTNRFASQIRPTRQVDGNAARRWKPSSTTHARSTRSWCAENTGTQAERYWGVLRTAVNDLARCYNLTPLGV